MSVLLVGLCWSVAMAGTIYLDGRVLDMPCKLGRYTCELELSNGNRFVQHPSVYIKLVKPGLYEEECVEFVEYIAELPPNSTGTYVIPLKTSCKDLVQPLFRMVPKTYKTSDWEKKVKSWTDGCPPRRVVRAK